MLNPFRVLLFVWRYNIPRVSRQYYRTFSTLGLNVEPLRGSSDAFIPFGSVYGPQRGPTSKPRVLPGEQINPPKTPRTPRGCNIMPRIQSGEHLAKCMSYIDLNMARTVACQHPSGWEFCGYTSIQNPPQRYQVIDRNRLAEILNLNSVEELAQQERTWVETAIEDDENVRDSKWSESIAVEDRTFVEDVMDRLGVKAMDREIAEDNESAVLREPKIPYSVSFDPKTGPLSPQNSYFWI